MNWFEELLIGARPLSRKQRLVRGVKYTINFMPSSVMRQGHSFGYALNGQIFVKADLSKRVQNFVINHEAYHLQDKQTWLGWIGGEARANAVVGLTNPIGLLATIIASLTPSRIMAYLRALLRVGFRQSR